MSVSPFVKRELTATVRSGSVFSERYGGVIFVAVFTCGHIMAWDYMGRDRYTTEGASSFALSVFGIIIATLFTILIARIPALVAPSVAIERDRKTLDSLLSTHFTAAEIILGKVCASLIRYANSLSAMIPLWVMLVFLGGVDLRWIGLGLLALFSTAVAIAALSAAISAGAMSATRATTAAVAWAIAWIALPMVLLVAILPKLWPGAPRAVVAVFLILFDSSPFCIMTTVMWVVPRGPLLEVVLRMIGLQCVASILFLSWAVVRLRPASRAVYDAEGRYRLLRILRARWRPRPACGDDPILWREMHSARPSSPTATLIDRAANLMWLALFAYAISWFAIPAFAEVAQYGYGRTPGTLGLPEINPFARVATLKLTGIRVPVTPGWARLEFSIVLRQASIIISFMYTLMLGGIAAESVADERQRDTWLGLIATPLSGWEILRGKWVGAIWKSRVIGGSLVVLWIVGLLGGALHPVGFVVSLIGLAVASSFLASLGVLVSLWSRDRSEATSRILGGLMVTQSLGSLPLFFPGIASVVAGICSIPFQLWCQLLSYDDVYSILRSTSSPQFGSAGLTGSTGIWLVVGSWLISTTAMTLAAALLLRTAVRHFDAVAGRPIRSRQAPRLRTPDSLREVDVPIDQGLELQKI